MFSKKKKYIVIKVLGKYDQEESITPIIFSNDFIHSQVARGIKSTYGGKKYEIMSAGFYKIEYDDHCQAFVVCFGRSDSLGMDSRIEDATIISNELGLSVNEERSNSEPTLTSNIFGKLNKKGK